MDDGQLEVSSRRFGAGSMKREGFSSQEIHGVTKQLGHNGDECCEHGRVHRRLHHHATDEKEHGIAGVVLPPKSVP